MNKRNQLQFLWGMYSRRRNTRARQHSEALKMKLAGLNVARGATAMAPLAKRVWDESDLKRKTDCSLLFK